MTDEELFVFYFGEANRAYGMARAELSRTLPLREKRQKAIQAVTKYTLKDHLEWNRLDHEFDPGKKLSKKNIAERIKRHLSLPEEADQTIRKTIRKVTK